MNERAGFVSSDMDSLRKVIVLEPGVEMRRIALLANDDHPSLPPDAMQPAAVDQHRAFVTLLRQEGVEVLFLDRLLDSALRAARQKGQLENWILQNFPRNPELISRADELTAEELVGRGNHLFYHYYGQGQFAPLLGPQKWLPFVRDTAVMTPRGLVLTQFANYDRSDDTALVELAFRFAPELADYPIAFDAHAEDVFLRGGDLMVFDPRTLLFGVGSLSEPRAAELLAQRLNMEVLAVSLAPLQARQSGYGGWTGVHSQFLHLDSVFNLVDRDKALAVPYVMESRYAENNPFVSLLDAFERDQQKRQQSDPVRHKKKWSIPPARQALKAVGWVTRYEAGTGHATPLNKKLVDVVRERGYKIIPVGGEQGTLSTESYLLERVLFELNFMASNVVAVRPGVVAAYGENLYTVEALRNAGVKVLTFPGSYLAMWHGGPHCLTLPIDRNP